MTAKHQPAVITIQPAPSAFERLSRTFATTPSPRRMSISVPMNSPKHFVSICQVPLPLALFLNQSTQESAHPVKRLANGSFPHGVHFFTLGIRQIWSPGVVYRPVSAQIVEIIEIADRQSGSVCRSQSCGRSTGHRTDHRQVENVGLELHQQIVFDHSTVGSERIELDVRIFFHRLHDVAGLESSRFKYGAGEVSFIGVASQAGDDSTRIVLPIRSVQTRKS